MISAILAICTLVTMAVFAREVAGNAQLRAYLSAPTCLLVLAVGLLPEARDVIGTFTNSISISYGAYDEATIVYAGWLRLVDQVSIGLAILIGLFGIVSSVTTRRGPTLAAWAVLIALASTVMGNLYAGLQPASFRFAAFALLIGSTGFFRASPRLIATACSFLGLLIVWLCSAATLLNVDQATRVCRVDKCGVLGVLLRGYFSNENALGLPLVLTAAFVSISAFSKLAKTVFVVVMLLVVLLAGSRTALIGVAVVALGYLITFAYRSHKEVARVTIGALIGAALVSQVVIVVFAGDGSFTGRQSLWALAFGPSGVQTVFGHGWQGLESYFELTGGIAGTSSYSLHNQALDTFYNGGVVAVICLIVVVVWYISVTRSYAAAALLPLAGGLGMGLLETPWTFGQLDWLSWSMVALVATEGIRTSDVSGRSNLKNIDGSVSSESRWATSPARYP